mgnify:FL=1
MPHSVSAILARSGMGLLWSAKSIGQEQRTATGQTLTPHTVTAILGTGGTQPLEPVGSTVPMPRHFRLELISMQQFASVDRTTSGTHQRLSA